jgi:hypothetical protein
MTLRDRIAKLRRDNPLFTVAGLTEITLYGDSQEREGDFLAAAAQVLHCSQAEVDEAVAFTGEAAGHFAAMSQDELVLASVRDEIAKLPEDGRIRVEAIASTFRNCIALDPLHAGMAMALVGAEQTAK